MLTSSFMCPWSQLRTLFNGKNMKIEQKDQQSLPRDNHTQIHCAICWQAHQMHMGGQTAKYSDFYCFSRENPHVCAYYIGNV